IKLINANSPQAKGRIERKFRFFQDRLVKEMRLRDIKNYEEANRFLRENFLPWCNNRYTHEVESLYREVPEDKDLDLIFSKRQARKVNKDNTDKFQNEVYQLLPSNGIRSFAGTWIEISESSEGKIEFLYEGKRISFVRVGGKGELKRDEEEEEFLKERVYVETLVREEPKVKRKTKVVPSANHPWRRA
ncbi:MAG: hypothetical protein ACK4F9_05085, partial [Brevinematia bacterium]